MKTFTEWMKEHTLLAHYRVEDPVLMSRISNMDGVELEQDDDGKGGTIVIDEKTHRNTALELKKMALAGHIRSIAGEVTRDMTGKARPMGTQYEPTQS